MAAVDPRIESYLQMRIGYLRVLALRVEQVPYEIGDGSQSVQVELLKKDVSGRYLFTFQGARMLEFADLHPGLSCCLYIDNVVDHQLEGLRYKVSSGEQDLTLRFYCYDFGISELPLNLN
jgi:hypothetical protein